jgi:ketosteroid isomerase-like protein
MEKEELIKADKAWSLAAKTNDMEKLWSFWEDEAIMLISTDMTLRGIEQIKRFTTQARTDPNFEISWEVQGAEVSEKADMGYTFGIGKMQRTSSTGELISTTKPYLIVWRKQSDGTWKCIIEN